MLNTVETLYPVHKDLKVFRDLKVSKENKDLKASKENKDLKVSKDLRVLDSLTMSERRSAEE